MSRFVTVLTWSMQVMDTHLVKRLAPSPTTWVGDGKMDQCKCETPKSRAPKGSCV